MLGLYKTRLFVCWLIKTAEGKLIIQYDTLSEFIAGVDGAHLCFNGPELTMSKHCGTTYLDIGYSWERQSG